MKGLGGLIATALVALMAFAIMGRGREKANNIYAMLGRSLRMMLLVVPK